MKKISIIIGFVLLISCQNNTKKEEITKQEVRKEQGIDKSAYTKKGKEVAHATFKAFVGHIKQKSHEGGLPAVVNFCHDNALKLTDSMSRVYNVKIKRSSHKLRNPHNAPDSLEKEILDNYFAKKQQGDKLSPIVKKDTTGKIHFYAPIIIKKDCLKCHGEPGKDIPEPIYKLIKEKYPQDQATGFKIGDLRGIWDITFPKQ